MNYEILLDGPQIGLAEVGRLPCRFNFLASDLCPDSRSKVRIKGLEQNVMVHKYQLATDFLLGSSKHGKVRIIREGIRLLYGSANSSYKSLLTELKYNIQLTSLESLLKTKSLF